MFSGIVESVKPILSSEALTQAFRISVEKPTEFDDLKIGDSIACDGVCLTLEKFDSQTMQFALAAETIKVLNWQPQTWIGKQLNLERSLRFGDRIHGHLVTGHVDSQAPVLLSQQVGESWFLKVQIAESVLPYLWVKGSVTLNGVSLTINSLEGRELEVCLIPETVKRTNLGLLKLGDVVNVEPDYMAKAVARTLELSPLLARKNTNVL